MTATLETLICPTWCTRDHTPMEFEVGDVVHDGIAATPPVGDLIIDQMVLSEGRPEAFGFNIIMSDPCPLKKSPHNDRGVSPQPDREGYARKMDVVE